MRPKFGWASLGISRDSQRFFVLQWEDLFSDVSLDTWQVRSSNVKTVLAEIIEATLVAEEHASHRAALSDLFAEALDICQRDEVIKLKFPSVRPALEQLLKDSGQDLAAIRRKATVLSGCLRDYRAQAIGLLRAHLVSGEADKQKELQSRLTMAVATELASGHSLAHLEAAGDAVLRDSRFGFIERYDSLMALCDSTGRDYKVLFCVPRWPSQLVLHSGTNIHCMRADSGTRPNGAAADRFFGKLLPHDRILTVSLKAADAHLARRLAERALGQAIASISFGSQKELELKLSEALVIDSSGGSVEVGADDSRRAYLKRSTDWKARCEQLIQLQATLPQASAQQLGATLEFYRLAMSQPSDEVRFVNLWVATENLVRGTGAGGIADRVASALSPAIAIRNIRRVARGLTQRLGNRLTFKDLRSLGILQDKRVDPFLTLGLLDNDAAAKELLGKLKDDPLLRHRIYRFKTGALKNSKSAADYIAVNARNIGWQLKRIYRTRNALVHRGQSTQAVRQLIQHLQYYLWMTIRSVQEELSKSGASWTISDALEHQSHLYEHAMRCLKSADSPTPLLALLNPDRFLGMSVGSGDEQHLPATDLRGNGQDPRAVSQGEAQPDLPFGTRLSSPKSPG